MNIDKIYYIFLAIIGLVIMLLSMSIILTMQGCVAQSSPLVSAEVTCIPTVGLGVDPCEEEFWGKNMR